MTIVAIAGQKGGIGKTSLVLSLAVEWHARGRRVLVVDADEQATALTWASVAAELEHDAPPVIRLGDNLRSDLPGLAAAYEITIVDTPGRTGRRATYALALSRLAVLPCGPTAPDVWAMAATLEQVRAVQAVVPELEAVIAVARKQPGTVIGQRAARVLADTGVDVLESELCSRVAVAEALADGRGPTTYAPRSAAARETRALADELERRLGLPTTRKRGLRVA